MIPQNILESQNFSFRLLFLFQMCIVLHNKMPDSREKFTETTSPNYWVLCYIKSKIKRIISIFSPLLFLPNHPLLGFSPDLCTVKMPVTMN